MLLSNLKYVYVLLIFLLFIKTRHQPFFAGMHIGLTYQPRQNVCIAIRFVPVL